MLTGDQGITARQIGYSSGIITEINESSFSPLNPVIDINSVAELAQLAETTLDEAKYL